MTHFLDSPSEIRERLRHHLQTADSLDMAVAFVSSEWLKLFEGYGGKCRILCWLRTTNTNPYAVASMMKRSKFRVRHMDFMHAKVYLYRGASQAAIVGSANLSSAALSGAHTAGNIEAAIETTHAASIAEIGRWFDDLWAESNVITTANLSEAKKAWDNKPKTNRAANKGGVAAGWTAPNELKQLARKVRSLPNTALRMEGYHVVHPLVVSRIRKSDLVAIVDNLTRWAKHRGKFAPLIDTQLSTVRRAFTLAFDSSIPDGDKMNALISSHKLPGLGVRAWSIILSWRSPTEYAPFDGRTSKFLKDTGLTSVVPKSATPLSYGRWCVLCRELAIRLRLPTPGHVDRMVWLHTRDMTEKERAA